VPCHAAIVGIENAIDAILIHDGGSDGIDDKISNPLPASKNYWKTYFGPGGAAVGGTEKAGIGASIQRRGKLRVNGNGVDRSVGKSAVYATPCATVVCGSKNAEVVGTGIRSGRSLGTNGETEGRSPVTSAEVQRFPGIAAIHGV